jgi:hypothetical protein
MALVSQMLLEMFSKSLMSDSTTESKTETGYC